MLLWRNVNTYNEKIQDLAVRLETFVFSFLEKLLKKHYLVVIGVRYELRVRSVDVKMKVKK